MAEPLRMALVPGLWNGTRLWQVLLDMSGQATEGLHLLELPWLFTLGAKPVWGFDREVAAYEAQLAQAGDATPWVLVAHSYGAQHALQMMARRQVPVAGVVLLAPALGRGWWLAAARRTVGGVLRGQGIRALYLGPKDDGWRMARLAKAAARWPRALNLRALLVQLLNALWQGVTLRARPVPEAPPVPVLVVWSDHDGILPAGRLPAGAMVTEWRLAGEGHFLFMGEAWLWEGVNAWVAQL